MNDHAKHSQEQVLEFLRHIFNVLCSYDGFVATAPKTVKHNHRCPALVVNLPSARFCTVYNQLGKVFCNFRISHRVSKWHPEAVDNDVMTPQ